MNPPVAELRAHRRAALFNIALVTLYVAIGAAASYFLVAMAL